MVFIYLLSAIAGVLVKAVDFIEDSKKGKNIIKWPLSLAYGIIIGYLISQTPFSMIFLAALFAQLLAGKIDTSAHGVGFTLAVLSIPYFGIPANS